MKKAQQTMDPVYKQVSVLSQEEEINLFKRYEQGDINARNTLIEHNIRFVAKIARTYKNASKIPLEDLISEGTLGLISAIDKFDYKKGYRFTTFAAFGILQAIITALRKQSNLIRLPQRKCKVVGEVAKLRQMLTSKYGHQPSVAELAELVGETPEELTCLLQACEEPISVNADEDNENTFFENLADKNAPSVIDSCQKEAKRQLIDKVLKNVLDPREEKLIRLRFGLNERGDEVSLREAGKAIGVSQEGARRMENRVLTRLNKAAYQLKLNELR